MSGELDQKLNSLLVETFRSILKVEEKSIKVMGIANLSINELHMLEAIGKQSAPGAAGSGATISAIAQELGITLPSTTVMVNRLAQKGYVEKIKGQNDGRVVIVTLTRLGKKMDRAHRYFHRQMIRHIGLLLSDSEKEAFAKGVSRLDEFFRQKITELEV